MLKVRQAAPPVPSRRAFLGGATVAAGALVIGFTPVSYTHLTLPTNREV